MSKGDGPFLSIVENDEIAGGTCRKTFAERQHGNASCPCVPSLADFGIDTSEALTVTVGKRSYQYGERVKKSVTEGRVGIEEGRLQCVCRAVGRFSYSVLSRATVNRQCPRLL